MASNNNLYVRIGGIYCAHCVETITRALKALDGVESVSLRQNIAHLTGPSLPDAGVIVSTIQDLGYETDESSVSRSRAPLARALRWYELLLIAGTILLVVFVIDRAFGYNLFNAIPTVDSSFSYGMLFVTGLLTSVHCISMCGAIGICASAESNSVRSVRRPLLYNAGRVLSYTLIGGLVGMLGSTFTPGMTLRGIVILAAAVLMLLMSLSMLGILSFRLPQRFRIRTGRPTGAFTIGLLNGLMPCGPLQAMQLYALSTGSARAGALSMMVFALGTAPLMLFSGAAINLARGRAKRIVSKVAPVLMLCLALSMMGRGLTSLGVDLTQLAPASDEAFLAAVEENGIQTVEFSLEYDAYADIVVQKDLPVRMIIHVDADKLTGCNNQVVSRDFGFDVPLKVGDNVIEFLPGETGVYTYSCWMNMIHNTIKVI